MERAIDKAIVLLACVAVFAVLPWDSLIVVALLVAVALSALAEVVPPRASSLLAIGYALFALALPPFLVFLPLSVYDLMRDEHPLVRACWTLPALAALVRLPFPASLIVAFACLFAALLSFRTRRTALEKHTYRHLFDDIREASLVLEEKNRGLLEKQDLEVRLATLAERDRIAREIHDNVGHLLTRSIMQVEALQVVHRDDERVCGELAQMGDTLHEAMSTVRASVHDLHDDAFDLESQIGVAAAATPTLAVDVDYRVSDMPSDVGYCFIAIVREALSNAARHGDADRVAVSVATYPAFYRLIVHDNGSKPPPSGVLDAAGSSGMRAGEKAAPCARRGIGLVTMADRARALGGRCQVDYDRGVRVFVTVPKGESA